MKHVVLAMVILVVSGCAGRTSDGSRGDGNTPSPREPSVRPTEPSTAPDESLAELDGTEWILVTIDGQEVAAGFEGRLRFVNGNEIGGSAACDGFGSTYRLSGSTITLTDEVQRTHFDCNAGQDPNNQRNSFINAFGEAHYFHATENHLELLSVDGNRTLTFVRFAPPPVDPRLVGDWLITEVAGEPPVDGGRLSLRIANDLVGGFSGCNDYGGRRSPLADNALMIEEIASNAAGCPSEPHRDQEVAIQSAVGQAMDYTVDADELMLLDESGNVLLALRREPDIAMNPDDLIGTSWVLLERFGTAPPDEAGITLRFDSAAALGGFAGCRGYSGTYNAEEDDIFVTSLGMDSTVCLPDDQFFDIEHQFISGIGSARRYVIDGDRLELQTVDGRLVLFRRDEG